VRLQGLSGGDNALSLEDTVTAGTDITLTGGVTQSGALTLTSTNGSVTIANDVATGANTLTVNALQGNAALPSIGGTSPALDVNASTATLNGSAITTDGTINFEDADLTTLAGDVTLTSTNNAIDFGDLGGENTLTVVAGTGAVTFDGGDIGDLTVTSAANVDFDEDFNTDGQINVTSSAEITVADGSNVTADDTVLLDALNVDIDGVLTGHAVDVTATAGDNTAIQISGTINGNDGNVTIHNEAFIDGHATVGSDNANVDFNDVVNGDFSLTAAAANGQVAFASTVGATTALSGLDVNADVLEPRRRWAPARSISPVSTWSTLSVPSPSTPTTAPGPLLPATFCSTTTRRSAVQPSSHSMPAAPAAMATFASTTSMSMNCR
jgi:hypothetical protein